MKAGISSAQTMTKHPDLTQPCIQLLITHMEVYADLVIATQNLHINIPDGEEALATLLTLTTVMGES